MKHMKNPLPYLATAILGGLLAQPLVSNADTQFTITTTTADAFLMTGSPANPVGADLTSLNFGGAGTLAIAPANSTKGRSDSIIKFNLAGAVSSFNTTYGAGNWQITGLTLRLASNFGDQGEQPNNGIFNTINAGLFAIDWLGNDSWVEGTGSGMGTSGYPNNSMVTYNSISTLYSAGSATLGTFTYTPPGDNIYRSYSLPLDGSLVTDATAGGDVSLYFYAADTQVSYLFNAKSFASNFPQFVITAAVPEPGTLGLAALCGGALFVCRARRKA